jgi:hypothetical protein
MNSKLTLHKTVLLLIMLILPYGNITNLVGVEDGLVYIIYPLCLALFLTASIQNHTFKVSTDGIIIPIYITLAVSFLSYTVGNVETPHLINYFLKFFLFILLFNLIQSKGHRSADFILHNFSLVFLSSIVLSLCTYIVFRKPEFIFYDGSAYRFAGFHFELFNFCFSSAIFCASLIYKNVNKLVVFCILCLLLFFSKSNFSAVYVLVYLGAFCTNILNTLFIRRVGTLIILVTPIIIGSLLNELSFLSVFSIRESSSFDHNGSALYTRLYPYSLAYAQLVSDGYLSLLPRGFGYFESSDLVVGDSMSYGGTGVPKEMVNLGLILFSTLVFSIIKKLPKLPMKDLRIFNFIWFSTLCYISFGSGFFNLFAWVVLASLFNWRKTYV